MPRGLVELFSFVLKLTGRTCTKYTNCFLLCLKLTEEGRVPSTIVGGVLQVLIHSFSDRLAKKETQQPAVRVSANEWHPELIRNGARREDEIHGVVFSRKKITQVFLRFVFALRHKLEKGRRRRV